MVNINKLKLTKLQQHIVRLMCTKSELSLNAHEISRLLDVSQAAISKALPDLEKRGILTINKDKVSKRLSIALNRSDHTVIWMKRIENFSQLYGSGLVQALYGHFPSATIILFGSYAFGEDTSTSDIDLAVIGAKQKDVLLALFEGMLQRPITLHHYHSFSRIEKNLLNNILSGIVLKGSVEL